MHFQNRYTSNIDTFPIQIHITFGVRIKSTRIPKINLGAVLYVPCRSQSIGGFSKWRMLRVFREVSLVYAYIWPAYFEQSTTSWECVLYIWRRAYRIVLIFGVRLSFWVPGFNWYPIELLLRRWQKQGWCAHAWILGLLTFFVFWRSLFYS